MPMWPAVITLTKQVAMALFRGEEHCEVFLIPDSFVAVRLADTRECGETAEMQPRPDFLFLHDLGTPIIISEFWFPHLKVRG